MAQPNCRCCGGEGAYIACPPSDMQGPSMSFGDLVNNCVCWECYVAVVHPVDRKLANAKARLAKSKPRLGGPGWHYDGDWLRAYHKVCRDKENIEAWGKAIASRKVQRQLYGVES